MRSHNPAIGMLCPYCHVGVLVQSTTPGRAACPRCHPDKVPQPTPNPEEVS